MDKPQTPYEGRTTPKREPTKEQLRVAYLMGWALPVALLILVLVAGVAAIWTP